MGKHKKKKRSRGPTLRKEFVPPTKSESKFSFKKFYIPLVILISLVAFCLHLYGADYSRRSGALDSLASATSRVGCI